MPIVTYLLVKNKPNVYLCFDFRNATHGLRTSLLREKKKVDNLQIVTIVSVFLTNENPLLVSSVNIVTVGEGGSGGGFGIAMTTAGTVAVTSS